MGACKAGLCDELKVTWIGYRSKDTSKCTHNTDAVRPRIFGNARHGLPLNVALGALATTPSSPPAGVAAQEPVSTTNGCCTYIGPWGQHPPSRGSPPHSHETPGPQKRPAGFPTKV
jgi:hypothetical protein